jgi:hypothetical protein
MIGGPSLGTACGPACSGAARCASDLAAYDCRRRLCTGPLLSKPLELLRKLKTVSVRVEHVQKPDLVV